MQIFPEISLLTSEYDKIRDAVAVWCVSDMGKQAVERLQPVRDAALIGLWLARTAEMQIVLSSGLPFPSTGYVDISKELSMLQIQNSTLAEPQFISIATMMHSVKDVFVFFRNRKGQFPELEQVLEPLRFEPDILWQIEEVLDEAGVVRTSASTELTRIRRALQRNRAESDRIYLSVISRLRRLGWLSDPAESSRSGRRVLAVIAEQKRSLRGVIHDTSTTGKTLFLEPEEALAINQATDALEQEERLEITRILRALAASLRKHVPLLQEYLERLGIYDFNRAKALFGLRIDGIYPGIKDAPFLSLCQARHPLLLLHNQELKKNTIPFDLKLGGDNRILVISGPNAGGKTVCMKTAGLLQMMLQSGMPVSAGTDSEFGLFDNLFVDIGDSQSIEYELSTYSSRLKNMRVFLEQVGGSSLFLIDEFGTGTDPNLGGALAESILEELNARKATGIVTTHYLNLKVMADNTPGLVNGSMEFDLKRLRPLYRLSMGKPGSSYTFLVAERSGLPPQLIKNARRKVARKNLLLEKLLTQAQHDKESLRLMRISLSEKEQKLNALIRSNESQSRADAERIAAKEHKLQKNEERLLRESEERFRNFMKEWKKARDKKEVFDKYYRMFVRKPIKTNPETEKRKQAEKLAIARSAILPGTVVRLSDGKTPGVVESVEHDKAFVIFGNVRAVIDLVKLVPAETAVASRKKPDGVKTKQT
jgi:DNA mismatch repair protein MutS2